ncbi:MAG: hypothetical protein OEZ34_13000 [Spirochaetia bacterium]|nr:hypothetical protein [Spirochaetia bacterium]
MIFKLIFFTIFVFILWNLGKFFFLVYKSSKILKAHRNGNEDSAHGNHGRFREKDITGKARILEEESKDDR